MSSRTTYYDNDEWIEYDESLRLAAERHGVEIIQSQSATGLWEGETEPAGAYLVRAESFESITSWAGEVAGRYNQDGVMAGYFTPDGPDHVLTFSGDAVGEERTQAVLDTMRAAGVAGGRLYDGRLEIAVQAEYPLPPAAVDILSHRLGTTAEMSPAKVEFVPATAEHRRHTPIKEIQMLRQNYADTHGFPRRQRMPHLTDQDDIAAARAYAAAPHEPHHPRVARSYRYFRQHIAAQWDMLIGAGYRFDPWHGDGQPYADSAAMLADLRDNKHLSYFPTGTSQHTDGALPSDHPMAALVTVATPSGERQRKVANDVFRAVHDSLAHSEGHEFGPFGERRAWWVHRSCLPRDARLALWCETRGQNCWTNAGPHMLTTEDDGSLRRFHKTEPEWIPQSQRPYAAQKAVRVHPSLL